jgi:MFS family permease
MLGVAAFTLGPWVERHGPRRAILLGSTIFGLGNAITAISLSQKSIIGVYVGYGVLTGFGIGLNYISPVSALQKYFPDHRGVASGFAVGGFGAGSAIWSKSYLPMLDAYKLPWTFGILAFVQTAAMLIAAMVMRTPPADYTVGGLTVRGDTVVDDEGFKKQIQVLEEDEDPGKVAPTGVKPGSNIQIGLIESMTSPDFWFMYLMLFANQLFGLVVFSRLSSMVQDLFQKSPTEGSTVVAVNGIFNFMGRLSHPLVGELVIRRVKVNPPLVRKITFMFTLCTQISILGGLRVAINTHDYGAFRALVWCCTMVYGGGFGTIPVFLTDMFGPYNIGALHGLILTAWSIGGVGGGLGFTHLYNVHKPAALAKGQKYTIGAFNKAYTSNFTWIQIVMGVGLLLTCFVRTDYNDRISPGWRYSIWGRKVAHFFPKAKSEAIHSTDEESKVHTPQV